MSILFANQIILIALVVGFLAASALGWIVFRNNRKSASNLLFVGLCIVTSCWLVVIYSALTSTTPGQSLFLARTNMFLAAPQILLFFLFAHTFPEPRLRLKTKASLILLGLTFAIMYLSFTPLVFKGVTVDTNGVFSVIPGMAIFIFAIFAVSLSAGALLVLANKIRESSGVILQQFYTVTWGIGLMLFLIITTILLPVAIYGNNKFANLAPLYTLFFLSAAAYAIIRQQLFNVKVIAVEAFVFIITIIFFARTFVSPTTSDRVADILIFIATIGFGILLVRSVREEVRTREKIQGLAKNLSETNWELAKKNEQLRVIDQRKSEFVSIVSHQLRTPITAIKGYSSLLMEGTFGPVAETQKPALDKILVSSNRLAEMVSDFLDISKIEQGTMAYTFKQVDFGKMVGDLLEEFQARAKDKKLSLEFKKPEGEPFLVTADEGKVRQIISNVIDNSIKYTPAGGITVSMERDVQRGTIICKIADTGVGLSQDDLHHLFGKFTRGSEGSKINTGGSGLGLYVAKKMLQAHKGDIWVDSEGINKGSTFVIVLPADGSANAPHPGTVTASTTEEGK